MRDSRGFLALASEIRQELASLHRLRDEIVETWGKREAVAPAERQTYVESTALKLHNFYTALERIFERIAGDLDGGLPQTPDRHLRLLRAMSAEVPEIRPSVLRPDLTERLVDYLRFRHLVRNIYGFKLDERKMVPLVETVGEVSRDVEKEIGEFLAYLEHLGHEASD
jgi:hypothetical protein